MLGSHGCRRPWRQVLWACSCTACCRQTTRAVQISDRPGGERAASGQRGAGTCGQARIQSGGERSPVAYLVQQPCPSVSQPRAIRSLSWAGTCWRASRAGCLRRRGAWVSSGGATNMLIEALPRNVNVVQAQSLPPARAAQTTPTPHSAPGSAARPRRLYRARHTRPSPPSPTRRAGPRASRCREHPRRAARADWLPRARCARC